MAQDSGYSGTPQLRKLGIKPGLRLAVVGADDAWEFAEPLEDVERVPDGPTNVALVFVRSAAELDGLPAWSEWIFPAGSLWIAWPRKAAGHVSDVTENAIRDGALELGLVDVKVAAIDTDWSGLKLMWRRENRTRS
ncbi:DUF3052 domain-containing protein [Aeromicrobium sp. 9AM]|uniref:DUF3052 domain-containing protein n=1 Tax=Aeromicrobium sp. 9AM TaxID=2653126 RepID=UPI0012F27139|nr:DUF3052 domain-containing protein [Aeromicrobium sp. 9AM]VXC13615.1 conserved hypothetical protein [Aeromicrobium sp. 9AM]